MNIEEFRGYCLSLNGVTEDLPFGDDALVFKVCSKMFALCNLGNELQVNLKCDPEIAIQLREKYPSVLPGYHMNKKHWNTIIIDGSINDLLIKQWIFDSYNLVVKNLSKIEKELLNV